MNPNPKGSKRETPWLVTHGMKHTPEYDAWGAMWQRCTNRNNPCWKQYGGRAIEVCERWEDFANFYADVGARPSSNHSIDRINNNGNYEPSNCRWATRAEQAANTRHVRNLEHEGQTLPLRVWAKKLGINPATLRRHLRKMSVSAALTIGRAA